MAKVVVAEVEKGLDPDGIAAGEGGTGCCALRRSYCIWAAAACRRGLIWNQYQDPETARPPAAVATMAHSRLRCAL